MKCEYCKKPIIPDIPGLEPKAMSLFDGEDFILHAKCAEALAEKFNKLETPQEQKAFLSKVLRALSMVFLIVVILACARVAFGAEPQMSCSIYPAGDTLMCQALNADAYDIQWTTIAYGKPQFFAFGREVRLPATHKYWTLFVMSLYKDGEIVKQSAHWFRIQKGQAEGKPYTKGIDPNADIPEDTNFKRACIVSILGVEGRVFYEPVLVVGETPDDFWVMKEGYDKPINIPKEKVLLYGQTRMVKAADGQQRKCQCPT